MRFAMRDRKRSTFWWRRTSRRRPAWFAMQRRAATGWMRCGMTTSTTQRLVALTGKREAYYTDYFGSPQEFISAAKYGFLYQGQHYKWQKKRRGSASLDLQPWNFVTFLENHDQVANSALGQRVHKISQPGTYRALTTLLLLGRNAHAFPGTGVWIVEAVSLLRRSPA